MCILPHISALINAFIDYDIDMGVINVSRHIEEAGRMAEILTQVQLMASIGSVFNPEAPARVGQFLATPATSYDAIIFVRYSTPATPVRTIR